MTPSISVIVCTHSNERLPLLRSALKAVFDQDHRALEVVVVVDHNPALHTHIRGAFPQVTTVANSGVRGLSASRNSGVDVARGEIVAFLDDDAVASPDWLRRIAEHYHDSNVVGVGGRAVPLWPSRRPRWFPEEFDWVIGCSHRGLPEEIASVRNLIGCNMSFRRGLFAAVGGFSQELGRIGNDGSGGEETEFCIRVRRADPAGIILYDPEIVVRHSVTPDRVTWRYFRQRCRAEGRSKSLLASRYRAAPNLATERHYATRTLPAGVLRGFADALTKRDVSELARSGAIVWGLICTTSAYLLAGLAMGRQRNRGEPFCPLRVLDVDVAGPLPALSPVVGADGEAYGGAFCLVRRNGQPLGVAEISFNRAEIPPDELRVLLESALKRGDRDFSPRITPRTARPFITVLVATRDRPDTLAACLDSLLRQQYDDFDIVIVDSAPASSRTAELVERQYLHTGRVRYIHEQHPGLGRAHDRGMSIITSPIVAITDDDVVADSDWLSAIAAAFGTGERVGCVTGLILPAELETRAQYWTERHGGFCKGFARRVFDCEENRPADPLFPYAAGQFGSGANMAFRTDVIRQVGGFDPALGAGTHSRGGDDLAAFFAVIRAGYQVVYEPHAIIWHYHRRSEQGMRRQALNYGIGLGAYLTKLVVERPATLLDYIAALPAGFRHLFAAESAKNRRLPHDYPSSLIWLERIGIVAGIPSFIRSRISSGEPVGSPGMVACRLTRAPQ